MNGGKRPRVVVVGAGFGGLRAARALRGAPVEVLLLDRNNYHLFQPLLYQVATAGLEPEQIAKPLRAILRGQENLTFQMASVTGVDLAGNRLETDEGTVSYDFLILAVGAETDFFGLRETAGSSLKLKELGDGVEIRNHVLRCFERAVLEPDGPNRSQLLTFLIVGGGPTGVEMAGALAELIHLVLLRDYPKLELEEIRVILLELQDQLLPGFPEELARSAEATLADKGVEVRLGTALDEYDGESARLAGGGEIGAKTLIWGAGVRANSLVEALEVPLGRSGRVPVEQTLQLPEHPEVFVIGDAAYLEEEGEPLPMMAPVAIQMAERVVDNITLLMRGEGARPFEYRDPGSLATIGRNAAVASIGGFQFTGFPAWAVWLVVHLIQLIGFRNRLFVLINWAWDYFFYERGVRLITEPDDGRP